MHEPYSYPFVLSCFYSGQEIAVAREHRYMGDPVIAARLQPSEGG